MGRITHTKATTKKSSRAKAKSTSKKASNGARTPSLERAFRILEEIAADGSRASGLSFTEIKDGLRRREAVPNGSLSNLLHLLNRLGYLHFDESNKLHSLGHRFINLGEVAKSRLVGRERDKECVELLKRVVDLTNYGAHIAGLDGADAIYLLRVESPGFFTARIFPGKPQVPHVTAVGKALICCFGPEQLQRILDHHPNPRTITPKSITRLDRLVGHLKEVREAGYAIDNEEHAEGVRCVAAPIYSAPNTVIAAIGISTRKAEVTLAKLHEFGEKVLKVVAADAANDSRILHNLRRYHSLSNKHNKL